MYLPDFIKELIKTGFLEAPKSKQLARLKTKIRYSSSRWETVAKPGEPFIRRWEVAVVEKKWFFFPLERFIFCESRNEIFFLSRFYHKSLMDWSKNVGLCMDFWIHGRRSWVWDYNWGVRNSSLLMFYHNFHLFFPICERKEFVLFQLLIFFDILLKKLWPGGYKQWFQYIRVHNFSAP